MPYRQAGFGICSVCNSLTQGALCTRCGKDLCRAHIHDEDQRCPDCEAEYRQIAALVQSISLGRVALRVTLAGVLSLLLVLMGQLETFPSFGHYMSGAGVAMAGSFVATLLVICRGRYLLRSRFLAQRLNGHRVAAPRRIRLPALPPAASMPLLVRW